MNEMCTKQQNMDCQNCEIVPKKDKVYKKYNKMLAILDKM